MIELSPRVKAILMALAGALLMLAGAGGHSLLCPQGPCPCDDAACTCPCRDKSSMK
ncbi:MAG: hypothetical protein AB7K24_03380 [Gemmataceae bacterium]